MSDIFEAAATARHNGESVLLATVIRTQGSVPRHAGAKMLIYTDGRTLGTVGGGEMESRVITQAPDLLKAGSPTVLRFDLAEDAGVCGGQVEIFIEPILPKPTVLIIGAGHCGQALADLAHWLGYYVIVTDDRPDLCNPEVIPHADEFMVVASSEVASAVPIHEMTYVAAVTRGVPIDVKMLPALLATKAPYIGVMGSRRRWSTTVKQLTEAGVSAEALRRVHAPIGLELNAETPRQIAVSIMAEIIAQQRGGTGESMKWEAAHVGDVPYTSKPE